MSGETDQHLVAVVLTSVWADPRSARSGLPGGVLTQLVEGEPVRRTGRRVDGWLEVTCPWQPTSLHPAGYPGWLRATDVADPGGGRSVPLAGPAPSSDPSLPWPDGAAVLTGCGRHLGVPYLWGGTSPRGLDCSGLVHLGLRELGRMVPRDARDQLAACVTVPIATARPGDLYFFGRDGADAHHVGIVSGPGRMLHASQAAGHVLEEALDAARRATLVAAGRFADTVTRCVYDH